MRLGGITSWANGNAGSGDARPAVPPRALALLLLGIIASAGLFWLVSGSTLLVLLFVAGMLAAAALIHFARTLLIQPAPERFGAPDWSITHAAMADDDTAMAITDRAGRLVCANSLYLDRFGPETAPSRVGQEDRVHDALIAAGRVAWRDGKAQASIRIEGDRSYTAKVTRAGRGDDHLIWRFEDIKVSDLIDDAKAMLAGRGGKLLSAAGILVALIGPQGRIRGANAGFLERAAGDPDANLIGRDLVSLLRSDEREQIFFEREGRQGSPLRMFHMPLVENPRQDAAAAPSLIGFVDSQGSATEGARGLAQIEALLALLPIGLAVTDRDGRFMFLNQAFARAAGIEGKAVPPYPGDLVIREDKAALSDAVRRYATGQSMSGDVAVRLKSVPDEPTSLGLAGIRGLGDAAVLISLKDSTEEARLKRQVAQATKMQAVGQLAGGVAHDFNNVLTAIIGTCDLMLLRHGPGDSDYDDIQQIRSNSNRAASLTRQLLAFSRQQTLRPQVLQLPDVIAEVSNLLKRLLGEKIILDISHDRGLGPVRADPMQLEQVIVNLAVNARDAMAGRGDGSGTLKMMTRKVTAADVRAMKAAILPPADYSALIVEDSGTGIPPEIIGKIFEPFFTTKDVGKGTGLGLSTVYGIVKQSGGYIFADSEAGQGTRFTIYLPVHDVASDPAPAPAAMVIKAANPGWGTGHILLVEDEDMVRAVAERALTRQGYTVTTARDGEDGLTRFNEARAENAAFDIVISDVVMPNLDGPSMVRKLRGLQGDLPVLFMSGYAEEQLRKSINLPDTHFIAKPFSVAEIGEAVARVLSAKRG